MRRFLPFAFVALVAVPVAAAHAVETLPVIVSYEMLQKQKLARLAVRDPKAFWVSQIVARIEDKKPREPLALKTPVVVNIHFVVGRDGHLVEKAVKGTSGIAALDASAMATIDRAQPFPPMPPTLAETDMSFDMPIRFRSTGE